ncbi:MAG TPA: protein phosphatase CheZ [Alphaproteobacteria bacterium]|jgi:chemotaxis protein CheZ
MSQNNLKIDDAHDYLQKVLESLRTLERREKGPLVTILEYISGYIRASREEIRALRHGESSEVSFTTAADELEEIVSESTTATNTIMTAAETVEDIAGKVADPELADRLRQEATRVYEACTFHDITGQRIAKVVRTLQSIEKRVNALAEVCGADLADAKEPAADADAGKSEDAKLLNGPGLANTAKTQDEIDRLFDSLA